MAEDRVLLALSGGVDSAVTVRILQQQGFAVEAAVIRFSPAHDAAVQLAQTAAAELGIPLSVLHAEALFEERVVAPFCEAYAGGRTPNPCVLCNPGVKFRLLAEEADRRGIHFLASGHYARMAEYNGVQHIAQAASLERDQSYMLYRLPLALRERLCLPLGEFKKPVIRQMAAEMGLSAANQPDSQEICFIPSGDYAAFLAGRGYTGKPGRFLSPEGQDLGPHLGVAHYTVGQRRRLGVALGKPVFVQAILPEGDIQLAWAGQEYASAITLAGMVSANEQPLPEGSYTVKIRSMAPPVPCTLRYSANGIPKLFFSTPQRAPAPGQHAVLYQTQYVVGGGEIDASTPAPKEETP